MRLNVPNEKSAAENQPFCNHFNMFNEAKGKTT
jgi:hypothetical protein